MKTAYPVIFTQTSTGVLVEVPDMEILTEGTDIVDAIDMSRDAIGLKGISLEDDGMSIPNPSKFEMIDLKNVTFTNEGLSFLSFIDIDFAEYRKRIDNKMVRRNVTLPNWLNQAADKADINVSKVLQEALIEKLEVTN